MKKKDTRKYTNCAFDNGFKDHKDIIIKKINSITIDNLRTLKDKTMQLGENITLISGKNGTMKTTILGLFAHPFTSKNEAQDIFGSSLKTDLREVFKLSLEKDKEIYWYQINITSTKNINFSEPVRIYQAERGKRFRVVVGEKNEEGKNTGSCLNFSTL